MAREMKDSGIEWIGKIPKDWDVIQLKHAVKWKSIKNHEDAQVLSLYRDYGILPKDSRDDNHNVTSLDTSGYKFVEPGDLVINKMKAWQGSIAVSLYEGIVSPAYHVCEITNSRIHKMYLHYLLRNPAYLPEYMRLSTGMRVGQWDLGFDDFINIPIVVPSIREQETIVRFINLECARIDAVMEQTRASIEEYKKLKQAIITQAVTKGIRPNRPMKDSRVDWIGKVPANWHIAKLKYFCSIRSGITLGKVYPRETKLVEYPYLRVANVQGSYTDLSDVATIMVTEEEAEKYRLHDGELLMTEGGDRDKLGRGTVWHAEIDPCLHQNHVFALRTKDNLSAEYVSYLSASAVGRDYFDVTANQSVHLASTNSTTIMNFSIPLPTIEEQNEIVLYLNKKITAIDEMIEKKQDLISNLENYKKSMIYEYVTGKKGDN